ncbi:MAG: tRNA pseudouridine synthase Pus10 [Promethearchaeota archaeon]|nr:MAG: tRNA pseudouridine synthase Pus10 [Candidatus Lokiarchaeota archaeon]
MNIFEKTLEIYKDTYICLYCLGRMFSMLATHTTNYERGKSLLLSITMEKHGTYLSNISESSENAINYIKILAENANFIPAQQVLEKEGYTFEKKENISSCFLCKDLFKDLARFINKPKKALKDLEFNNILVGCSPDPKIINREDKFKGKHSLLNSESFKSHFNREMGKILSEELGKPAKFENPDIVIIFTFNKDTYTIELMIRSLYIYGRYKKLIRGIPQTKWPCSNCNGKGCKECDYTGKLYQTSVEELISPEFLKAASASDSTFHGAGREDIDVRMLGTGRPFVLELENPKKRDLDLESLRERTNKANEGKIEILNLRYSDKDEVRRIKAEAENTKKRYRALCESQDPIEKNQFEIKLKEAKESLENKIINQRTPHRVSHRRSDKIRKKKIYVLEGEFITPDQFQFEIETQGGTYIKELISGDEGRTSPSLTELFGNQLSCINLDVMEIKY